MNCPKCGLPTLPEQKFCRSCGDKLQIITQPLAEQAAASHLERTPAIILKNEPQPANSLTLWGFIIMFIGVAIGVIAKKLMHNEVVTVLAVLVSLVGMFLTVYPFIAPARRQKDGSIPSSQPEVLTQSQSTRSLPPESNTEYVSSVTERTTDLLKASVPTKPRQKEGEESKA